MPIFVDFTYLEKNRHFGAAKSQFNISGLKANSYLERNITIVYPWISLGRHFAQIQVLWPFSLTANTADSYSLLPHSEHLIVMSW
jgi:hypothetical protein